MKETHAARTAIPTTSRLHLWLLALLLVSAAAGYYEVIDMRIRHFELREPTDTAAMMQVVWTTAHGAPFTTTLHEKLLPQRSGNFLAEQLHFTLALLAPLARLTDSPQLFLIVQCLIAVAAGWVLFVHARRRLEQSWLALLLTTSLLVNPGFVGGFLPFGFRIETLFVPLVIGMFALLAAERPRAAFLCVTLLLLTKHNASAVVVVAGCYFVVFHPRQRLFGIACVVAGGIYYLVAVRWFMAPMQFDPTTSFKHLRAFGDSEGAIVATLLSNPQRILAAISPGEWLYVKQLLWGSGVLALLHPIFWLALPQLVLLAILDDYQTLICEWHWALVIGFVYLAEVEFLRYLNRRFPQPYARIALILVVLGTIVFHGQVLFEKLRSERAEMAAARAPADTQGAMAALAVLPPEATVMASGQLLWFLWNRNHLYTAAARFHDEVDYVAIALPVGEWHYRRTDLELLRDIAEHGGSKLEAFRDVYLDKHLLLLERREPHTSQ